MFLTSISMPTSPFSSCDNVHNELCFYMSKSKSCARIYESLAWKPASILSSRMHCEKKPLHSYLLLIVLLLYTVQCTVYKCTCTVQSWAKPVIFVRNRNQRVAGPMFRLRNRNQLYQNPIFDTKIVTNPNTPVGFDIKIVTDVLQFTSAKPKPIWMPGLFRHQNHNRPNWLGLFECRVYAIIILPYPPCILHINYQNYHGNGDIRDLAHYPRG